MKFPWFVISGPFASFLRLDFSEVAILVALITLGYKDTLMVVILRSFVRLRISKIYSENIIGDMISMIASLSIILGFFMATKIRHIKTTPYLIEVPSDDVKLNYKNYVVFGFFITLSLSLFMVILNFFVTTPLLLSVLWVH